MEENEEKMELVEIESHPINCSMAAMALGMKMMFSTSLNEMALECIIEQIAEIRADIISGNKTEDEIGILFEKLERLSIEKHETESLIRSIKRMRKLGKKLDEKEGDEKVHISEHYGKLKKLLNKNDGES